MTRKIFKYEMSGDLIQAPSGNVRLVAQQFTNQLLPTIWIEHDENDPIAIYVVHGTGHSIPDDGREHVGSCLCGQFVWHVYRLKGAEQ